MPAERIWVPPKKDPSNPTTAPKRGFVASGGGSRGWFHIGVLRHRMRELRTTYDAYSGVSVGALICAFLAQYPAGQEVQAYNDLYSLFTPIVNEDVYKRWFPFGRLHGLWKPSLYNSQPLRDMADKHFDPQRVIDAGKTLSVGAVSLRTRTYEHFDQHHPEIRNAVLASASYPVFLEPVTIEGEKYWDGGLINVSPIKALIDAGCDEIDISVCHPPSRKAKFDDNPNALDVAGRSLEIVTDSIIWDDLKIAGLYNKVLQYEAVEGKRPIKLNVIHPKAQLNKSSLEFDPTKGLEIQDKGYEASKHSTYQL
jgi:predicted acylesterase/phospholipase RssA